MRQKLAFFALIFPLAGFAEDGYVHGSGHCYYFDAPRGWVVDNISGKRQGVPIVFYPDGSSWDKATTVIYSRSADFAAGANTPKEKIKGQVDRVLEEFQESGNGPAIKAALVKTLKSRNGAQGELWKFWGDRWGNFEMVAYFAAPNTVNFFVMTSRDKNDFERSVPALVELASSYRESDDCKPCADTTLACSGPIGGHR